MKTMSILLVAASLSTIASAAFAQPSDSVQSEIDRQIVLGNVKASNDSIDQRGTLVEGRQATRAATANLTDAERFIIEQNARETDGN